MDLFYAINSRRSIRRYSDKRISEEDLKKIISAGINAPSACDIQGWRFIIINDRKVKEEIVNMGAASFIKNAPLGIIVLYNNQTDNLEYMDHIQSAAASIQNIILAAHSLGIGSCWVCHLPRKQQLRDLMGIPKTYDPIACIALGYPENEPRSRPRKKGIEEVISYNKFKFTEKPTTTIGLKLRRFFRKIYYFIPFREYIKPTADKKFERKFEN